MDARASTGMKYLRDIFIAHRGVDTPRLWQFRDNLVQSAKKACGKITLNLNFELAQQRRVAEPC
jgi:hypothetical protein